MDGLFSFFLGLFLLLRFSGLLNIFLHFDGFLFQTFHLLESLLSVNFFRRVFDRSSFLIVIKDIRFIASQLVNLVMIVANAIMLVPLHLVRN